MQFSSLLKQKIEVVEVEVDEVGEVDVERSRSASFLGGRRSAWPCRSGRGRRGRGRGRRPCKKKTLLFSIWRSRLRLEVGGCVQILQIAAASNIIMVYLGRK